MASGHRTTLPLVTGLLLASATPGAFAQGPVTTQSSPSLPTPALHAMTAFSGGDASLTLSRYDAASSTQIDVLFGRNSTGPYQLSWKNAQSGSDTIVRNGVTLQRDLDYTLDLTAGTVTFKAALGTGDMVRISYGTDTPNATPNAVPVSVPLEWDIWQSGQNQLRVMSLYRTMAISPNSATAGPTETLYNALQFMGTTRLMPGSTLTTGMFLDMDSADWLRRGGFRAGDRTQLGNNLLAFDYSRGGSLFVQGATTGVTAGRELIQASDTFTPYKPLSLNVFARQITALVSPADAPATGPVDDLRGNLTREAGSTVAVALPGGGKVSAGVTVSTLTPATGAPTDTIHDTVQVVAPTTHGTQATVGFDTQTSTTVNNGVSAPIAPASLTQTTTVDVKSAPTKLVTVTGSFRNTLDGAGPQDSDKVTVEATPVPALKKLKISTSLEDKYQRDGVQRNRAAIVALPPLPLGQLQISGGVKQTSTPGHELNTGLLDATARPFRYVEFTGAARLRDGTLAGNEPDPNAVDTYNAQLALTPWRKVKLTATMVQNPEANDGTITRVFRHGLGLQSDLGFLSLHGQYAFENAYLTSTLNQSAELGLDLHLTRWDTLSTGIKAQNVFDTILSSQIEYQLGFTHHLNTLFDLSLSGSMTTYDQDGRMDPDRTEMKAQAKLGLHF